MAWRKWRLAKWHQRIEMAMAKIMAAEDPIYTSLTTFRWQQNTVPRTENSLNGANDNWNGDICYYARYGSWRYAVDRTTVLACGFRRDRPANVATPQAGSSLNAMLPLDTAHSTETGDVTFYCLVMTLLI